MRDDVDATDIHALLRILARKIQEAVAWARANDSIRLDSKQRWIRPDPTLYCRDHPELSQFSPRVVEYQELFEACGRELLDVAIKPTTEFLSAMQALERFPYGVDIINGFMARVVRGYAENNLFNSAEHVDAAVAYLFKTPVPAEARLWLDAITANESIVAGNITFRPPTSVDFEQRSLNQSAPVNHHNDVSCIAEWHLDDGRNGGQLYNDRLLSALRLFRLGSVQAPRFEGVSLAFKNWNVYGGNASLPVRFRYSLRNDDAPELLAFLETISPLLPSKFQVPPPASDFFATALGWYEQAVFSADPIEASVAWAVACLEALYLGDNPNAELNYRLGLRTATLLRCFGFPPLAVKSGVKEAYEVRSKYVHGVVMPKRLDLEKKNRLLEAAATYARISLLAWRCLTQYDGRKDLLTLIEDAILDSSQQQKLQSRCDAISLPSMLYKANHST